MAAVNRDSAASWQVRAAVRKSRRDWPLGDQVCVALSGGADSLALTAAAVTEFPAVTALVVDHQLQDGSAQVAFTAAEQARALGAQAQVLTVEVASGGSGMEAAARDARYRALAQHRNGLPVLLGHTLDDQAETVLLGLARGSGARSLSAMAPWNDPWARPLLGVRAVETRAACTEQSLAWWDDPHNVDPAFTRVRVRHEVMPLLEEVLGGGAATALARTAELLRQDDEALHQWAQRITWPEAGQLDVADLSDLPPAVFARVVQTWLRSHGVNNPTHAHLTAISALVFHWDGQGPVAVGGRGHSADQPHRLVVERRHGKLVVATHQPH